MKSDLPWVHTVFVPADTTVLLVFHDSFQAMASRGSEFYEDDEGGVYLNLQGEDKEDEESQLRRGEEAPKLGGADAPRNCRATDRDTPTQVAPTPPTEPLPLGIDEQEARVLSRSMALRILYGRQGQGQGQHSLTDASNTSWASGPRGREWRGNGPEKNT